MIASSATANPVLTATLRNYMQEPQGLVGLRIAPLFLTAMQSAQYFVFDINNQASVPRDLRRAPGTRYKRTELQLSDGSYSCKNKGIEIPVDDEERAKYSSAFAADEAAMRRARSVIMLNHEVRVRDMALDSGTVAHTNAIDNWDDYDSVTGDPVGDVEAAKSVINSATGLEANLMILPRAVFIKVKEHPGVLDKIKYSQRGVVTTQILSEIFGLEVLVPGGLENTAADGQSVSISQLWTESVFICHAETSPDLEAPNFARTFGWTAQTGPEGILVESYREDNIQSDVHRCKQYTDEKVTGATLGYYITDTLA